MKPIAHSLPDYEANWRGNGQNVRALGGNKMSEETNPNRRHFLGTAAKIAAAT